MSTKQVLLYARLKPIEELKRFLAPSVMSDLYRISLQNKDNMIKVRTTSNPEVFVELSTGWTVYESCVEYFVEPLEDLESEPAEGTFNTYPNPSTPKEFREPVEPLEYSNVKMYEEALKEYESTLGVTEVLPTLAPFCMTKTMFNKVAVQRHRTHYVKLVMKNEHLSFRFFYESEDNKHQEGRWFLKDHDKKSSIEVNKDFIQKHFEDIVGAFEVIGRLLPKKGYMKIIKNLHNGEIVEIRE